MLPMMDHGLGDELLGLTQPAAFATIDPASSTPRSFNIAREQYTPYRNLPTGGGGGRIIPQPRKRYMILPPTKTVAKPSYMPGVRYLQQFNGNTAIIQRRPNMHLLPGSSRPSSAAVWQPSNRLPMHQLAARQRNTYVLRIPVHREEPIQTKPIRGRPPTLKHRDLGCSGAVVESMSMHIPTVPPSMSMGGEYIEDDEEFEEQDEIEAAAQESYQLSMYYPNTIKRSEAVVFSCRELDCFWRGPDEASLIRHTNATHSRKRVHPLVDQKDKPLAKPKGVRCSECDVLAYSRPLLLKHMNTMHGLEAPLINRTFDSRDELQRWLEELRTTHAVEFVVSSGSKKWGFGLQVHYLTCSRSGEQKERPNKKFARPPRPSIKCGKNCMAYLKIKQDPVKSTLQIEGCLHHSGHYIDGTMIRLTVPERRRIAMVAEQSERNVLHWDSDCMGAVREVLGHSGRFRLITDASLNSLLRKWIVECKEDEEKPQYYSHGAGISIGPSTSSYTPPEDNFELLNSDMMLETYEEDEYDEDSPASPLPSQ